MSVAKSWWKWGPKMAKLVEIGNGNWFSLENQIFQGFTLCPWQKVGENGVRKWQNCKKTEAELDFLRKIKFFKASPQYSGKKLRNFSNFKPNKQIFFFFRSKNPENLRGFLDPHQIFQENQGFNAFLCGKIFQIFAISIIFSSNFLSDFVIVAKSWLKRGPKEEN